MTGDRAYEFAAAGLFISRGDPRLLGRILAAYGPASTRANCSRTRSCTCTATCPSASAQLPAPPEPTLDSLALTWFGTT